MVSLNRPVTIRVGDWPLQLIGKASNEKKIASSIVRKKSSTNGPGFPLYVRNYLQIENKILACFIVLNVALLN